MSEIVAESGAPRGSLYFYFPGGKDELACAALEASGREWRARIAEAVDRSPDLDGAIGNVVKLLADDLEASGWDNGCPVAAVALESISPPVREAIVAHYTGWLDAVAERLERFGVAKAPARQIAMLGLSPIEGALLLARVLRSREPLVTVGAALRAMVIPLLAPPRPAPPLRSPAKGRRTR